MQQLAYHYPAYSTIQKPFNCIENSTSYFNIAAYAVDTLLKSLNEGTWLPLSTII